MPTKAAKRQTSRKLTVSLSWESPEGSKSHEVNVYCGTKGEYVYGEKRARPEVPIVLELDPGKYTLSVDGVRKDFVVPDVDRPFNLSAEILGLSGGVPELPGGDLPGDTNPADFEQGSKSLRQMLSIDAVDASGDADHDGSDEVGG